MTIYLKKKGLYKPNRRNKSGQNKGKGRRGEEGREQELLVLSHKASDMCVLEELHYSGSL